MSQSQPQQTNNDGTPTTPKSSSREKLSTVSDPNNSGAKRKSSSKDTRNKKRIRLFGKKPVFSPKKGLTTSNAIFGRPLQEIMHEQRLRGDPSPIPDLVTKCIEHLLPHVKEEGLFRKSGTCSNIQHLKTEVDTTGFLSPEVLQTVVDCHDISGLLKQFIRELPEPLVPAHLHDTFFAVESEPPERQKELLLGAIKGLDRDSVNLLAALCAMMQQVAELSEYNLMPESNLSRVWAPNIFFMTPPDPLKIMEFTHKSNAIFQIIITEAHYLFANLPANPEYTECSVTEFTECSEFSHQVDQSIDGRRRHDFDTSTATGYDVSITERSENEMMAASEADEDRRDHSWFTPRKDNKRLYGSIRVRRESSVTHESTSKMFLSTSRENVAMSHSVSQESLIDQTPAESTAESNYNDESRSEGFQTSEASVESKRKGYMRKSSMASIGKAFGKMISTELKSDSESPRWESSSKISPRTPLRDSNNSTSELTTSNSKRKVSATAADRPHSEKKRLRMDSKRESENDSTPSTPSSSAKKRLLLQKSHSVATLPKKNSLQKTPK